MGLRIWTEPDRFVERVHSLPPELFWQIYRDTFTADAAETHMDETSKSPSLLQVDRASRALFAPNYYSKTKFVFRELSLCQKWLISLPGCNLLHIREIDLRRCRWHHPDDNDVASRRPTPPPGMSLREFRESREFGELIRTHRTRILSMRASFFRSFMRCVRDTASLVAGRTARIVFRHRSTGSDARYKDYVVDESGYRVL